MKRPIQIVALLLLQSLFSVAQFSDSFVDSNFTHHPAWQGDSTHFIVNDALQLQLLAPAGSNRSQLRTISGAIYQASWEWWMRIAFNPSSANYADIYLLSDQAELDGPLQGYFVRVGNTTDEVSLYHQSGSTRTKIIDGVDGLLNRNNNVLKVKVERSPAGEWRLHSDTTGTGQQYQLEGSVVDVQQQAGRWFGLRLVYSSTRADKFFFDDFAVLGSPIPDTIAPEVVDATLVGSSGIRLTFSEAPTPSSMLNRATYELIGFGPPFRATGQGDSSVLLEWISSFPQPAWLELDILGLIDSSSNRLDTTVQLLHRPFQRQDVVINELLPKESPSVGLPMNEFVELYNTTDYPISIKDWQINDLTSTATLGDYLLQPHSYLILCPRHYAPLWNPFGPVLEVHPWPTLNNDQDELRLVAPNGLRVDTVFYRNAWLQNPVKEQGGWTLERVDAWSDCQGPVNWRASVATAGGTPGAPNSVSGSLEPLPPPQLVHAVLDRAKEIQLYFSSAVSPGTIILNQHDSLSTSAPLHAQHFSIPLPAALQDAASIEMRLTDWVDCQGQAMLPAVYRLMPARRAVPGELRFNEVYFRPSSGGTSYFELINVSADALWLDELFVGAADVDWNATQAIPLSQLPLTLPPGERMAFCRDSLMLRADFPRVSSRNRWQMNSWPTLNQSGGRLLLLDGSGATIDRILFHDSLHHALLMETRGMALERLEGEVATPAPWGSAQTNLRGSPGEANSRFARPMNSTQVLQIQPEIIHPHRLEQLEVRFTAKEEVLLRLDIVNIGGQRLHTLLPQQLVNEQILLHWDGTDGTGAQLPAGMYLIRAQFFTKAGNTSVLLKRCVLSPFSP